MLALKLAQTGQLGAAYSISTTLALGLPRVRSVETRVKPGLPGGAALGSAAVHDIIRVGDAGDRQDHHNANADQGFA